MNKEKLQSVSYELYTQEWVNRNVSSDCYARTLNKFYAWQRDNFENPAVEDLHFRSFVEKYGFANIGCYVCKEEFLQNEFTDYAYMRDLLILRVPKAYKAYLIMRFMDNEKMLTDYLHTSKEEFLKIYPRFIEEDYNITTRILQELAIIKFLKNSNKFRYQFLDRLRNDCVYYLGRGGRDSKTLWALDEREQIISMKILYCSFPDDGQNCKPNWINWVNIRNFEEQMLTQNQ